MWLKTAKKLVQADLASHPFTTAAHIARRTNIHPAIVGICLSQLRREGKLSDVRFPKIVCLKG